MTNLASIRDQLAAMRASDDMVRDVTINLRSQQATVLRVDADATQVEVRWPDGTVEVLRADEVAELAGGFPVQP